MPGQTDIMTVAQNIVLAISNLVGATKAAEGNLTSAVVTADTLIITGNGRVVNIAVLVAGSASGTINNAATTASAVAANALMAVPMTVGVFAAGMSFNLGLVIKPGTGQSVNVTYFAQS